LYGRLSRHCRMLAAYTLTLATVPLVTFDGAAGTSFTFVELNDPVMGGKSTGTWNQTTGRACGTMTGEVVNVPSLSAPGFIKAAADGKFSDASAAAGGALVLTVRSQTTSYQGYRISFFSGKGGSPSYSCAGGGGIPFSRGCFKSKFVLPPAAAHDFVNVVIPFSNFSDLWSSASGDIQKTCAEDTSACVTAKVLKGIQRFEVWAEGVDGSVAIDLMAISAEPAAQSAKHLGAQHLGTSPPAEFDTCSGAVQDKLKYGISGRTTPTVPVAVDADETLAEAVCCDSRTALYAEPQFLFEAPDIALFDKLPSDGTPTTFYDSVCGLPLFKSPVDRTLDDFKADTTEHGWPSFRSAEVFTDNVVTNETTGFVTSTCGTHLGSYLPDDEGPRWCIDLSCVAGSPA